MASQVAKFFKPLFCILAIGFSFSAFAQICGRYLYSGPEVTTEEIISITIRKIFKNDSQEFEQVDAYLAQFLAQRAQKLSPRLRDEYLTKIEWVNWVDHIRTSKVDRSLVGTHDPKTNETYLVHGLKGTIQARLTLVHEYIHLEHYLTRTRTLLRTLTFNNMLKEEAETHAAEYDFLTGLFLQHPNLKERFLADESLGAFWNGSKETYICDGIRTYEPSNTLQNQSLLFKYGIASAAAGACTWLALWAFGN